MSDTGSFYPLCFVQLKMAVLHGTPMSTQDQKNSKFVATRQRKLGDEP